jgi:hypothetical protein
MASAAPRRARTARELVRLAALTFFSLAAGCRNDQQTSAVDLLLPDGVGRRVELVPKSAFAEYVELPEQRHELRITLASYDVTCRAYVAPGPNDVLFVMTLSTPPAAPLAPATFPLEAPGVPDGGVAPRPSAYAVARQGDRAFDFPAGGSLDLRTVDLSPTGRVGGVLALEFPGDGTRPAAGAHGKFEARMCQSR